MRDLTTPFTNNLAERAISFVQGQVENFSLLSYLGGTANSCAICSYLVTLPKHGFGMLHIIRAIFSEYIVAVA